MKKDKREMINREYKKEFEQAVGFSSGGVLTTLSFLFKLLFLFRGTLWRNR